MVIAFISKNDCFRRQNRPRKIATEAPLDANGATFSLQWRLRCTPKRPKTESKSATFESKQTLNRPKTPFSGVSADDKI